MRRGCFSIHSGGQFSSVLCEKRRKRVLKSEILGQLRESEMSKVLKLLQVSQGVSHFLTCTVRLV